MKIKAEEVKGKELKAGELFSTAGQLYWDNIDSRRSLGEKVYIRTNTPCPQEQENEEINRITIEEA